MSWEDRIRPAAYTSPTGERVAFDYVELSRTFERKTSAFEFPDADGTYVQDTGTTSRRFPITAIFWGEDCDTQADDFERALSARGEGLLEHPTYGQRLVVPFGAVTRRDDLVRAANQALVEVTFWETTGLVYPRSQASPADEVLAAVAAANAAAGADFADSVGVGAAVQREGLRGSVQRVLGSARARLRSVADTQDDVARRFAQVNDSIDAGIDVLIGDPLALAFQTTILIQEPARSAAAISARLSAYRNLAGDIFSSASTSRNDSQTRAVSAQAAVAGSLLSTVNAQFQTRGDALAAAEEVLDQFDQLVGWRDGEFAAFDTIDTGGGYQGLQDATALAAGYLVAASFDLAQERRIVLDRPRTIIDLCAELYGEVDSRLDFLIDSNQLTGAEILELPRGKVIRYYE